LELLKVLEDQAYLSFTGRVNLLGVDDNKYFGHIHILNGEIVGARFEDHDGQRVLTDILISEFMHKKLRFVVEPEIVNGVDCQFLLNISQIKELLKERIEEAKQSKNLKPPGHLRLLIKPEFVAGGEEVDDVEYRALLLLTEFFKVDELYANSKGFLSEGDLTSALVSLRRKGALKVLAV
jgi:hypothetical protein